MTTLFAGDMNVDGPECGAVGAVDQLLLTGHVSKDFMEAGVAVSSRDRSLALPVFSDPVALEYSEKGLPPPPTMVVEDLYSILALPAEEVADQKTSSEHQTAEEAESEGPGAQRLSPWAEAALKEVYLERARTDLGGHRVMGLKDVEAWLTTINGQVGRGSEFRAAAAAMQGEGSPGLGEDEEFPRPHLPAEGHLTLEAFLSVYRAELNQGKVWGVAHDLAALGRPPPLGPGQLFRARFDRLYLAGPSQPLTGHTPRADRALPHELHPSDHLPVTALFDWR